MPPPSGKPEACLAEALAALLAAGEIDGLRLDVTLKPRPAEPPPDPDKPPTIVFTVGPVRPKG